LLLEGTVPANGTAAGAPIEDPSMNTVSKDVVQSQFPELRSRHVFVKLRPGSITVLSGIVTSDTNWEESSQAMVAVGSGEGVGVSVDGGGIGVLVDVKVGVAGLT
jgi:hypothetical protein